MESKDIEYNKLLPVLVGAGGNSKLLYMTNEGLPNGQRTVFWDYITSQPFPQDPNIVSGIIENINGLQPIQTEEELHRALARFQEIINAMPGSPDSDELNALENIIDAYWETHPCTTG